METNVTSSNVTQEEKTLAMASHLLAFAGYLIPFGNIIGPLVLYLLKKDTSSYVCEHAREALNFQISITIYFAICGLLMLVVIGMFIFPVLLVIDIVFIIVAAVQASSGKPYRYPLSIRFVS